MLLPLAAYASSAQQQTHSQVRVYLLLLKAKSSAQQLPQRVQRLLLVTCSDAGMAGRWQCPL
jgi:hypothetical protein